MTDARQLFRPYADEVRRLPAAASTTEETYYPAKKGLLTRALEFLDLPFEARTSTSEARAQHGIDVPDFALYDGPGDFLVVCGEVKLPDADLRELAFSEERNNQIGRYLAQTGAVLVSNVRGFGLVTVKLGTSRASPVAAAGRNLERVVEFWPTGIEHGGRIHGIMMVSTIERRARIASQAGKTVLYIEYIESALAESVCTLCFNQNLSTGVTCKTWESIKGTTNAPVLRDDGRRSAHLRGRTQVMRIPSMSNELFKRRAKEETSCMISAVGLKDMFSEAAEGSLAAPQHAEPTRAAFGTLISFRRRALKMSLETLAERARIELDELLRIADDPTYVPEPRTVHQLSQTAAEKRQK